ncbi:MAG: hypothetical protein EBV10_12225, partial [Synechococcaceae bacterium WB6_1A_059]|nr:hypothetical protein [Synechococcaceae bacterium WB6_1A_059]
ASGVGRHRPIPLVAARKLGNHCLTWGKPLQHFQRKSPIETTPWGLDLKEPRVWGCSSWLGANRPKTSHHQLLSAQLARLHRKAPQTTEGATYSFAINKKEHSTALEYH